MQYLIELSAVVAGAIFGVLLARRHEMDAVGAMSLAFIVALGGGTLRDVLLDRHPLFWLRESEYPVIVFTIALAASFLPRLSRIDERWLTVPDAFGLGLFCIVGAEAAREAGTSLLVASLMGVITGCFGGVMGEVICNQTPSLFRTAPLYATCAFAGGWVYFAMSGLGLDRAAAAPLASAGVAATRLLAVRNGWRLPMVGEQPADRPPPGPDPNV